MLFGCVSHAKIGVDIECYKEDYSLIKSADVVFSDSEISIMNADLANFFILWTKKEAYLKAYGTGFGEDIYKTTNFTTNSIETIKNAVVYSYQFFSL